MPLAVTVSSREVFLDDLRDRLVHGQGFSVATMNLDHVVKLCSDSAFRDAYAAQSHVTADGRPVVWLNRLAGRPVDLVTGSDLVEPLAHICAETSVPIAMFGSTGTVLDASANALRERHPQLVVAFRAAPEMGFDPESREADSMIERIGASGARLCFVALGAPKQEIFAARAGRALPHVGFVSIGAGLDFIAGAQRRAPRLVRILAAEWLWRLLGDPRRLGRRYAACLIVLPGLLGSAVNVRLSKEKREKVI